MGKRRTAAAVSSRRPPPSLPLPNGPGPLSRRVRIPLVPVFPVFFDARVDPCARSEDTTSPTHGPASDPARREGSVPHRLPHAVNTEQPELSRVRRCILRQGQARLLLAALTRDRSRTRTTCRSHPNRTRGRQRENGGAIRPLARRNSGFSPRSGKERCRGTDPTIRQGHRPEVRSSGAGAGGERKKKAAALLARRVHARVGPGMARNGQAQRQEGDRPTPRAISQPQHQVFRERRR